MGHVCIRVAVVVGLVSLGSAANAAEVRGIRDEFVVNLSPSSGSACILSAKVDTGGPQCPDDVRDAAPSGVGAATKDSTAVVVVTGSDYGYVVTYYTSEHGQLPIEQSKADDFARRGLETYKTALRSKQSDIHLVHPESPAKIEVFGGAQTVVFEMVMEGRNGERDSAVSVSHYAMLGDTASHQFDVVTQSSVADKARADFEQALQTSRLRLPNRKTGNGELVARVVGLALAIMVVVLLVRTQQSRSAAKRQARRRRE